MLNGLSSINISLTDYCNKACWMCGRRALEKKGYVFDKEMDFLLLRKISNQIPKRIVCQFHSNGEPTCYSRLGDALKLFKNNIRCFDTNGKNLVIKKDEIIDNLDILTLSTFEKDPEAHDQFNILNEFVTYKGNRSPRIVIRQLGDIDPILSELYDRTAYTKAKRVLHSPLGSFDYKKETIVPEIGICLEILNKITIDIDGNVFPCVRFDPDKENIIGNLKDMTLEEIWNGPKRKRLLKLHIEGKRDQIPFCSKCHFWGCPKG